MNFFEYVRYILKCVDDFFYVYKVVVCVMELFVFIVFDKYMEVDGELVWLNG